MIEHSESLGDLAVALAKAQSEFSPVKKVQTADAGSYSYSYADLGDAVGMAGPIIAKHGLSVPQFLTGGYGLVTILLHESGQFILSEVDLPVGANVTAQPLGSATTYLRRYCYCAVLGIVTEDDDGAKATQDRGGESPIVRKATLRTDTGELCSEAQAGLIGRLWAGLGVEDRDERLIETAKLAGIDEIASTRDLTKRQATVVIDALKERAKHDRQ